QGWSQAANQFKTTTGPETGQLLFESWYNTAAENGELLSDYILREKPTDWDLVFPFETADGSTDFSRNNIANLPTYNRIDDLFQVARSTDYQLSIYGGTDKSNHFIGLGYSGQESI